MRCSVGAYLLICLLPLAAWGQRTRPVSTDESVTASDALIRVQELSDAGNDSEAVRVLQLLLEQEGDRLLPDSKDEEVFVPVRRVVHRLLLSRRELLEKYRAEESARASQLLALGEFAQVERTRLLTPAGFEAALRLAQTDLENARFEAARLTLEQLETHPERRVERQAADAAELALEVASFLPREAVRAWAARWREDAGLPPKAATPAPIPAVVQDAARSVLDPQPRISTDQPPRAPLQEVNADSRASGGRDDQDGRVAWVFPTVVGDRVLVNDGERLGAWDSTTLAPLWRSDLAPAGALRQAPEQMFALTGLQGWSEDAATVSVGSGVAVAPMGNPESGQRRGDRRVQARDVATGRLLWMVDPGELGQELDEAVVRGPALIEGDTVVLSVRKASAIRRTSVLFLVGLDLHTGRERWTRLVGSVGTNPWGRAQVRPDGGVVHQGVVYRGDDMGVLGAYEVATGRPVWVRVTRAARGFDMNAMRSIAGIPPYEMQVPVVAGDSIYFVEPGRERVIELSLADGVIRAARDCSAMGDPRYLLACGPRLLAVAPGRLFSVDRASFAEGSIVPLGPAISGGGIRGRVLVCDDRVVVPVSNELIVLSPDGAGEVRLPVPRSGNIVLATSEVSGGEAHLLINDTRTLSSLVPWEHAERLLDRRVAQSPRDPRPLLTYVELLHRSGHAARVPELTDAALRVLNGPAIVPDRDALRERLFMLLLAMARSSHDPSAAGPAPIITDANLLDAIIARLPACAQSPDQIAAHALEEAWLRDLQGRFTQAAESLQRVLLDDSLAEVLPTGGLRRPAGQLAEDALADLLRKAGPDPYAAFDEEALGLADARRDSADPLVHEQIARRYPVAAVAPELWKRAAAAHAKAGDRVKARIAAGRGLTAAELSVAIGRADQVPVLGELAATLAELATGQEEQGSLFRTLRRLADEHPTLTIRGPSGSVPVRDAASAAARSLTERGPLPVMGSGATSGGQVLEGWQPLHPMLRTGPGTSTDSVMMYEERTQTAALWAAALGDGRLEPVWTRRAHGAPTPLKVGVDVAYLFWPSARGGTIEAVGLDGRTKWTTPEFLSLFDSPPVYDPNDRIPTPLEGHVRPESIVVSIDADEIVLVQRTGFAAAISLDDGRALWKKPLDLQRVYDVSHVGGVVVVSGAVRASDGQLSAGVLTFDSRTGEPLARLPASVLGDHPRWIRPGPGGDGIVASAEGVARFDPRTGNVKWSTRSEALRASTDGWVVGGSLIVLDSELRLWQVSLEGGAVSPAPLESRAKMSLPVAGIAWEDRLVLSTTQGALVVDAAGRVVGADSLDSSQLEPPLVAKDVLVTIESPESDLGIAETAPYRMFMLEAATGRVLTTHTLALFEPPTSVVLLDGKVLVGQGVATLVLDCPTSAR
ncbi:MAG: hypothetical protein DYG92_09465 [Leptolyngbya sp. PLA1]|nr:hypothetical protein [Leptolyngbya sp. PLA1]